MAKIVKVLRSVYRATATSNPNLRGLQADYGREVSKNSSLSERIYEVCAERDSLKERSGTMSGSGGPLARNRRTEY
jgi:hypothetical protein